MTTVAAVTSPGAASAAPAAPAAPATTGRAPRAWLAVVGAFVRRDAAIAVSYRVPFALGLVQSVLGLAFLFFLGRLVGHRLPAAVRGTDVSYFSFAVIGTTMLVLCNVVVASMAQRLRSDQTTGTLEVLFTMPVAPSLTVLSSVVYQLVAGTATAVVTLAVAAGLGLHLRTTAAAVPVALVAFAAALVLFAAAGVVLAAYVLLFKRGETLTALVGAGLSLLGGVYYPVQLLPHGLRAVADVLPFTWALDVLRATLLQGRVPLGRLGLVVGAAAVALPAALGLFSAALGRARRRGTLGQY